MKIFNLTEGSTVYTSNAWYVTGSWKTLADTNTLIDAGMDPGIIQRLHDMASGVGKRKVDQIILTHNHYDHAGFVHTIKKEFSPVVLAWSMNHDGVDRQLRDGEMIRIGDGTFEVIHMPGHSQDSILLYCRESAVLFAGDSPLKIMTTDGQYEPAFIRVLERLARLPINTIYFGHGRPKTEQCTEMLRHSLHCVKGKGEGNP